MPGESYIQLPDNSYIHLTGDETPDQLSALRTKLSGMQTNPLTQQTNAAAAAAGVSNRAPVPLPGAGRKILGAKWNSPLDPSENTKLGLAPNAQPYATPVMPYGAAGAGLTSKLPFLPSVSAITSAVGAYGGNKAASYLTENPWLRDLGGLLGAVLGGGAGAQAEDIAGKYSVTAPEGVNLPWGFKINRSGDLPSQGTGAPLPAAPTPEEILTRAVKEGRAAKLPVRVPRQAAPPNNLVNILMGKGMSTSPESVQQLPPSNLQSLPSADETQPVTSTGGRPQIVTKGTVPQKSMIVDPNSPPPVVQGSYWSFPEDALRRTVLAGDRDAAIVYKQRFGTLPQGASYLTDVGALPNRGLYKSR